MMRDGNRTFAKLAQAVEVALAEYRDAEQNVKDATAALEKANTALAQSRQYLDDKKAELFEAHPELRPDATGVRVAPAVKQGRDGDGKFHPIEVDDPDDYDRFEFRERQ